MGQKSVQDPDYPVVGLWENAHRERPFSLLPRRSSTRYAEKFRGKDGRNVKSSYPQYDVAVARLT